MFWAGLPDLYFLSVACVCIWCRPWVYWALAVFACPRVLAVMWHFGRLVWNLFPVFQCAMVVCTFFMSFLGGKCYLRKNSWCMRFQHFGYQATDKERLENCLWYFQNSILLYGQMLVFCGFHFWTTAVKKAGVCICLDVVLQFSVASNKFLHLFGMKLNLVTTLF